MFRLWAKVMKNNHMIKDMVVENNLYDMSRTKKVFAAIEEISREFDLAKPLWLKASVEEFRRHDKVRFRQDNFIEAIDFDYLEVQVIEED